MASMQDSSRFSLAGQEQSITFKNESIHYNPAVLKVGTPRQQVVDAFGNPNASQTTDGGLVEDVYGFNPDGSKFVNPQTQARNIAAAVFTAGTSVAVRQARIKMTEDKLTLFHVIYSVGNTIQSVHEERLSSAPASLPPPPPIQPVTSSGME
ncbi:MAG TPA: hypothetical protein VHY56_03720 [Candidatus Binataceae bacterium]|nr:hypothetical protein [Candidatus Binataceae bacterium]